ncbi:MAG TPA: X2-like carbohydrate binding domain-containing protein, partial [Clostridia bacterium]|nr:X2-like carbohydrate binding domain-containing protein [Clostridia bacterium]
MRFKKATTLVLVLSLLLSIGTFASGATATKPAVKPANSAVTKSARLFPVSINGKFSFVDVNGKEILKTNFGFADDFVGGYAHIMNELGGTSGYIDAKGKKVSNVKNTSKANLKFRGAREIKGAAVIDLSKKVKRYTSTHDGFKANNEDYNIGDGFEVKIWTATGAPCVSLYKNGKIICDKSKQLIGQDIFLIVKYDNEKIIRFLYADFATGKLKTLYVDYNGNPIWTKTAQASLVSAAAAGNPSISLSTASFVQGAAITDLSVVLTPKGSKFKGIKGLTQGTQYTVSGNKLTILKSYLNTLV